MLFWDLHRRLRKKNENSLIRTTGLRAHIWKRILPNMTYKCQPVASVVGCSNKYGANAEVKIKLAPKEWEKRSAKTQRNRRVYNFLLYTTSCVGMSPSKIKLNSCCSISLFFLILPNCTVLFANNCAEVSLSHNGQPNYPSPVNGKRPIARHIAS